MKRSARSATRWQPSSFQNKKTCSLQNKTWLLLFLLLFSSSSSSLPLSLSPSSLCRFSFFHIFFLVFRNAQDNIVEKVSAIMACPCLGRGVGCFIQFRREQFLFSYLPQLDIRGWCVRGWAHTAMPWFRLSSTSKVDGMSAACHYLIFFLSLLAGAGCCVFASCARSRFFYIGLIPPTFSSSLQTGCFHIRKYCWLWT